LISNQITLSSNPILKAKDMRLNKQFCRASGSNRADQSAYMTAHSGTVIGRLHIQK